MGVPDYAEALHDIMAFSSSEKAAALGVEYPDRVIVFISAAAGLLLVCGLCMLRRSRRAEIITLWDQRWSRDTGVIEES